MSLLPISSEHPYLRRWHSFGMGIHPNELEMFSFPRSFYNHQHRWDQTLDHLRAENQARRSIIGKDGFQVCLDVHQFAPNEVTVKALDNVIMVDAKHEERPDEHGHISRQFTRRYTLPEGFNNSDIVSQLSSDGILTIKAPPPPKLSEENARIIQIQHTGPAHLTVGNKDEGKKKGDNMLE